jgi:hypothetical protein
MIDSSIFAGIEPKDRSGLLEWFGKWYREETGPEEFVCAHEAIEHIAWLHQQLQAAEASLAAVRERIADKLEVHWFQARLKANYDSIGLPYFTEHFEFLQDFMAGDAGRAFFERLKQLEEAAAGGAGGEFPPLKGIPACDQHPANGLPGSGSA